MYVEEIKSLYGVTSSRECHQSCALDCKSLGVNYILWAARKSFFV